MTRQLARLLHLFRFSLTALATSHLPARRRASPRGALAVGVLTFVLLSVGLEAAAETVKPEWRDPEYGHRLRRVKYWQAKRPDRPLVLVVGSSRTQYGVSPMDMGFPEEPGSPLVYNFGYRGATPTGVWLQFARALDAGVRPRAVLVQFSATEIRSHAAAEVQLARWAPRLSPADIDTLAPWTDDAAVFRQAVAAGRRDPWAARRPALMSAFLPDWQGGEVRGPHRSWEYMDSRGYCPLLSKEVTDDFRRAARESMPLHRAVINLPETGAVSERAHRAIVARCRASGIPVAMCWAPEGPSYRAMYTPTGRAACAGYERRLTAELGVPAFPAPDHLTDDDFADGYHLRDEGAVKYSRWLADNHLKPWLAEVLK